MSPLVALRPKHSGIRRYTNWHEWDDERRAATQNFRNRMTARITFGRRLRGVHDDNAAYEAGVNMTEGVIYALLDHAGRIQYVGRTSKTAVDRAKKHHNNRNGKDTKWSNVLRTMEAPPFPVILEIIDPSLFNDDASFQRVGAQPEAWWIHFLRPPYNTEKPDPRTDIPIRKRKRRNRPRPHRALTRHAARPYNDENRPAPFFYIGNDRTVISTAPGGKYPAIRGKIHHFMSL